MERISKLYYSIALFVLVLTTGVLGYMYLSNSTFVDALYMTIITMSTVGFGEVHPLSAEGKLFTIFIILVSIYIYGYTASALTEYFARKNFLKRLKYRRVQKQIEKLRNHTVVCGYGRNGQQAVKKLRDFHMPCVVIEKGQEFIDLLEEDNVLFVEGDATDDEILKQAGVENATGLISALRSDSDNLYVVLSAKQLNKDLKIISRASDKASGKKLIIAGADNTAVPDRIGGEYMASLLVTPDLVEFVDCLTFSQGEDAANLSEIAVNDLPKEYIKKTILDLDLRRKTGCSVIGFKTPDGRYVVNPEADTLLLPNSFLIVLGKPHQVKNLITLFD